MKNIDGKRYGNVGEAETLAAFTRLGVPTYIPWGDAETADMVADFGGGLKKIQCKSSRALSGSGGSIVFQVARKTRNKGGEERTGYEEGEVDYFALYNALNGEVYLVPWQGKDCRSVSLVVDTLTPRMATQRLARDFLLEKVVRKAEGDMGG